MSERRPIMAIVLLTACVMLPGVYVGGYFATVQRHLHFGCVGDFVFEDYAIGGEYSRRMFLPLHKLDRRWRTSYWDADVMFTQQVQPDSAVKLEIFDPTPENEQQLLSDAF